MTPGGTYTFADAVVGYPSAPEAITVTVTNNSTDATGDLTVVLSGENFDSYTLSSTSIGSIAGGSNASFTVQPRTDLGVGKHTATVTVSNGSDISGGIDVSFTVKPVTYTVNITGGVGMSTSGNTSQTIEQGSAMTGVVYTAADGYYFPDDYTISPQNGISVTRNSYTQVTVSGTPTANVSLMLTAATAKTKEPTPNAAFTATGPNTGTLSGVTGGMKFSIDGGTSWTEINSNDAINLTDLDACTISVVKNGDGNTTVDSDEQRITVTKAASPSSVIGVGCISDSNNDGKLQNVTAAMEYKLSTADNWTDGTGSDITGLANGTYYVRVKATGTVLASDNQTVTVPAYIIEGDPAAENIAALETLKQTLEVCNWTVAQATANDAESIKVWIARKIDGMPLNGASYAVEMHEVIPAQAGTLSIRDGTNGSFSFAVKLTKGSHDDSTYAEITVTITGGVITATGYDPANYTVTYNANGGMGSVASATVTEGESYTIAGQGDLVCDGYTFTGWNTKADGTGKNYAVGASVTITGDLTLYAQWRFIDNNYDPPVIPNIPSIPETPEQPSTPETPTETPWVNPYADVAENVWHYEAIKFVSENGIMNGIASDVFAPNATTTRAMVWTMLARLSGIDTENGASWYGKGQAWTVENGISDGTNATGEITREQLVVMLWRLSGSPKPLDSSLAALSGYTDSEAISGYAQQAMAWAIGNGIIHGMGDGTLNPRTPATRAQVATIFWRFFENVIEN